MKILILGGAGFIGYHLASKLCENQNNHVTICDNLDLSECNKDVNLQGLISNSNVSYISGDYTDINTFNILDDDYDQLYMLASIVGVNLVNENPQDIIRINTLLIINTLEWLKKTNVKSILFTSTSECYAGTVEKFKYTIPTPETVPLTISDITHPRFTYAVTKMLGESGFFHYGNKFNMKTNIVRYHNVFGPRMGNKHVIPHLISRYKNKENPFKIYGHCQTRSFNYISDAVDGTIKVMENGSDGKIYHIGSEDEITIETLTKYVGSLFNYSGEYIYAETYPGSVDRRCPDISKIKNELNYKPAVSWKSGVDTTVDWYINNYFK